MRIYVDAWVSLGVCFLGCEIVVWNVEGSTYML